MMCKSGVTYSESLKQTQNAEILVFLVSDTVSSLPPQYDWHFEKRQGVVELKPDEGKM